MVEIGMRPRYRYLPDPGSRASTSDRLQTVVLRDDHFLRRNRRVVAVSLTQDSDYTHVGPWPRPGPNESNREEKCDD